MRIPHFIRLAAGTLLVATLLFPSAADTAPEGWHKSLDDGLAASAKSSKPSLVITLWGPGT